MRSSRYERAPLPLSRAQCAAAALMAWRLAISPLSRRPVSAAARSLDRTYAQRRLCKAMRPGSRARPPPHRGARANATHTIRERRHTRNPLLLSSQCPAVPSPRDSLARVQRQVSGARHRAARPPLSLLSFFASGRALPWCIGVSRRPRDPCIPRAAASGLHIRQSAGVPLPANYLCVCVRRNHKSFSPSPSRSRGFRSSSKVRRPLLFCQSRAEARLARR